MTKGKAPDDKQTGKTAAPAPAGPDPRGALAIVLDAEIANLKAQVAAMEKQGANAALLETVRNQLRARQVQRVKVGPT
jgi:methionine synthase I (cobalamin-dependent)